jgi:hypothetical protein
MSANTRKSETTLVEQAVEWLRPRLPRGWSVERPESPGDGAPGRSDAEVDSTISITGPNGTYAPIAVEAKQSISPRMVVNLLPPLAQAVRRLAGGNVPLLVVSPWLSERSREVLTERGINYIDLTGNALLRLDNPALYLETVGSRRNPNPQDRGQVQLRGAKAARLIRLLADVRPPYTAGELAETADVAPGYVSRLLEALYRESLIERTPRGPVESVDVPALLRRWASSYDVFTSNEPTTFIASEGIDRLLARFAEDPGAGTRIAVTGSVAAARLAPVAAPAMLVAYYDAPDVLAREFDLLPADEGANVAILRPFDRVVWLRTKIEDGLRYAATSQVTVDCLTGNGRMPAEGEALLSWMEENESAWRVESLERYRSEGVA